MNMEQVILEGMKQVPALTIVVILVILFFRNGTKMVSSFQVQQNEARTDYLKQQAESRTEYLGAISRYHAENMEARHQGNQTIDKATDSADKQTIALHDLTGEVRSLRDTLNLALRSLSK